MAKSSRKPSAPLTVDLPESLLSRVEAIRRSHGLASTSAVIRSAIEACDFDGFAPDRDAHRQISVRITADQRARLKRHARQKHASVGELLRVALESMPIKAKKK